MKHFNAKAAMTCKPVSLIVLITIIIFAENGDQCNACEDITGVFEAAGLVPSVIPTAPRCKLYVKYPTGAVVNEGNIILFALVAVAPTEVQYVADPDAYYTIFMVDPDATYPNIINLPDQFLHWLVVNIPGDRVESGQILLPYVSVATPLLSKPHRYPICVLKQSGKMNSSTVDALMPLGSPVIFNLAQFIQKNNLVVDSGNYFKGVNVVYT